ncbi:murein hydrolase activator EnvC [uncultured Alistipes sp.]|uniref:murein hydrolase activator EnvC family protein n=1 Tax=uncultured Alistipes sp. TaxID=538949 RepID=UPI001F8715D2|nr:M23 family metallopeptidase [uncultured Alistipes sp.]HJC17595.1 M23 family metallopeptidase [Candidatus Alistipes stercorigallinarum]
MDFLRKIRFWWRGFFRKRRFSMLNATDNSEEWHLHLSPASIIAGLVSFVLLLFILILSLVAYTPVLEFLPGYRTEADRSRENLVQNIIRLDSMERMMNQMMTYNQNIALIMEGKTPVMRTIASSDSSRLSKVLVMPSHEDSLLRAQMEGDGPYSLSAARNESRRALRESMELLAPVEGILTEKFDVADGRLGVGIVATADAPVSAIERGTVIQSLWSPESGYTIIIQHANNLLSVYRNLSQSLVTTGQAVRGGEQIGYNAEPVNGEVRLFGFELWNNGKPVNPESYIVF